MKHDTEFLSDLILLRNDPDVAERIEGYALEGNPHAQFAMGLIYAEGRGVSVDLSVSWAWLTLATMQGDREAENLRNVVGIELSDDDYRKGKAIAAELETGIGEREVLH